jgi:hypothetical protein
MEATSGGVGAGGRHNVAPAAGDADGRGAASQPLRGRRRMRMRREVGLRDIRPLAANADGAGRTEDG